MDGLGENMGSIQGILKKAPGLSMDPAGTTILRRIKKGICKDCSVLRGRVALTDKDGNTISIGSGVYLHHIGFPTGQDWRQPAGREVQLRQLRDRKVIYRRTPEHALRPGR